MIFSGPNPNYNEALSQVTNLGGGLGGGFSTWLGTATKSAAPTVIGTALMMAWIENLYFNEPTRQLYVPMDSYPTFMGSR